jgi:hypothetical protein
MRTHTEIKLHYSPFIVTSPNHLLDGAQISMYVYSYLADEFWIRVVAPAALGFQTRVSGKTYRQPKNIRVRKAPGKHKAMKYKNDLFIHLQLVLYISHSSKHKALQIELRGKILIRYHSEVWYPVIRVGETCGEGTPTRAG